MPTVGMLAQAVFGWISTTSGTFLPEALLVWKSAIVLTIIVYGVRWILTTAGGGHHHQILTQGAQALATCVFVGWMLNNYNTPTRMLGGYSFHQFVPQIGLWAANVINTNSIGAASKELDKVMAGPNVPTGITHPIEVITYAVMEFAIWLLQGIMFALSSVAFIPVGVGILFGPIPIVCFLLPFQFGRQMFWGWVAYMVSWSMYFAVSAAIGAVMASAILFCLGQTFHGAYQGLEAIFIVKYMFLLLVSFAFVALRSERMTASLFGPAAAAASGFGHYIKSYF